MGKNRNRLPTPKTSATSRIPSQAGVLKNQIDVEDSFYVISSNFYDDAVCEVNILDQNTARRFLQNIKTIGRTKSLPHKLRDAGIDFIPVDGNGEYGKLFKNIPPDADLKEHKVAGSARLFYFIRRNKFYIVAMTFNHFETKKHR